MARGKHGYRVAHDELAQLGPRLRAARQERGWTLEELAGRARLSVSTLSRLESGKRQASLELLLPLTRHLGIRVDDLLEPHDRDPRVRRRPITRDGLTIAPLTHEASDVRAFKITYHPEAPERAPQVHDGHEWLYVLSGRLRLTLGEQELVLERGEAAEFDTTTPHRMRAEGGRKAEVLSIFNAVGERLHLHSHVDPAPAPA
ncbi:helix-turn-helix domain-containing protein [Leucobacter luti]|uniref:helix-turn-helix domain-containing protein n=1 Tax=Leucobacter luti TaxID=340320 RepID=UPI00215DA33D|nr:XRE family transcriptional regulator [Leucobacter luti]